MREKINKIKYKKINIKINVKNVMTVKGRTVIKINKWKLIIKL